VVASSYYVSMMKLPASNLRALRAKATCLALVAGYVDGYALRVYGNYVSYMSGNTTLAGLNAGQGHLIAAVSPGFAIAGFLGGSFAGNWFAHSEIRSSQRLSFATAAILLASFIVLSLHTALSPIAATPILSFAMGMINPAVSRIGSEPVSLTFVTGTLNKIASHLALAVRHPRPADAEGPWDTHLYRAFLEASVWTGFLIGAILSGIVAPHFGVLKLVPALVAFTAFALLSDTQRKTPSNQHPG
jgi:uncharacterized membrane protein YoaK (UPF0700 family)